LIETQRQNDATDGYLHNVVTHSQKITV
jgi:hypothetical protein